MNWHPKWNKYAFWMYGFWYGLLMRTAHKFNWHNMKEHHPNGDTMLHCDWCGIRIVTHRQVYFAETLACKISLIAVEEKS